MATRTVKKVESVKVQVSAIKENAVKDGDVIGGVSEKQVQEQPKQVTGETVVVCLNYPRDLKFMVPNKNGLMEPIVIRGNATNLKGKDKGIIPIGAYGITTGVPKDAWEWILKHRPDDEVIKKGLMFASTPDKARDAVRERQGLRHGYEPVSPDKEPQSQPYHG